MAKDECYILDLCDKALGVVGERQYRFSFLVGDADCKGRCVKLHVDVYYPTLGLAVEYRERQHSEPVRIMDRRATISGCSRGEQRKRYDERRRSVLPQNGITLLELDYRMFGHDRSKRLVRNLEADFAVVQTTLAAFVNV
jgi:hypothetical protein